MKVNLSEKEYSAIKELAKAQSEGQIQIKPVDKGGGFAIMNSSDYITEMNQQLKATFTSKDGVTSPFYEKSLEKQTKFIENLVQKGAERNLISKSDRKLMQPSGKPNRLYGLPKVHTIESKTNRSFASL